MRRVLSHTMILAFLCGCVEPSDLLGGDSDRLFPADRPPFVPAGAHAARGRSGEQFEDLTHGWIAAGEAPPDVLAPPVTLQPGLMCSGTRGADTWPERFSVAAFLDVAVSEDRVYAVDGTSIWTFDADLSPLAVSATPGHPVALHLLNGRLLVAQVEAGLGDYPLDPSGIPDLGLGVQRLTERPRVLDVGGDAIEALVALGDDGVAVLDADNELELFDIELPAVRAVRLGDMIAAVECDVVRVVRESDIEVVSAPGVRAAVPWDEGVLLIGRRDGVHAVRPFGGGETTYDVWTPPDGAEVLDLEVTAGLLRVLTRQHLYVLAVWLDAQAWSVTVLDETAPGGTLRRIGVGAGGIGLVIGGQLAGERALNRWSTEEAGLLRWRAGFSPMRRDARLAVDAAGLWTRWADGLVDSPVGEHLLPPGLGATALANGALAAVDGAGRAWEVTAAGSKLLTGATPVSDAVWIDDRLAYSDRQRGVIVIGDAIALESHEPGSYLGSARLFSAPTAGDDVLLVLDRPNHRLHTIDVAGPSSRGWVAAGPCQVGDSTGAGGVGVQLLRYDGRSALLCPRNAATDATLRHMVVSEDAPLEPGGGLALPSSRWIDGDWSGAGVLLGANDPAAWRWAILLVEPDTGAVLAIEDGPGRLSAVALTAAGPVIMIDGEHLWLDDALQPR